MSPVDVLVGVRAHVAAGWTQHTYASRQGVPVSWNHDQADAHCLSGALMKMGRDSGDDSYYEAKALLKWACVDELPHFNDEPGRTQAEVLAVVDKAIAMAKEQQL